MRHRVNLWSNHTSTVVSIALVLMVLGLLLLLGYHSYRATHDMQERITFKVDLSPDVSESMALQLKHQIEEYKYVRHVDYISKEQAAELFTDELGDDFVGFIGYNPLYPSLMVNFKSAIVPDRDQQLLQQFTKEVGGKVGVTGVAYQENVVSSLTEVFYQSFWLLVVVVALLLFVAIVLISNTISVAIYAMRPTIQTMRMVGAKNSFIARPFLWRSVLYGFLGAVAAIALLGATLSAYNQQLGLSLLGKDHLLPYCAIAAILIATGMLICWMATSFAVRKALKTNNR